MPLPKILLAVGLLVLSSTASGCVMAVQAAVPGDEISTIEISSNTSFATAYDVVDRLRRHWFREVAGTSGADVQVYLDPDQLVGGKESLRDIPASDVLGMRHLMSAEAVARFGQAARGGAIIVARR